MGNKNEIRDSNNINRRQALSRFLLGSAGCFVSGSLLKYFIREPTLQSRQDEVEVLDVFMETIVPGLDISHPGLSGVFYDSYFQFTKFRKILVKDLLKRTKKLFNVNSFKNLQRKGREEVIRHALHVGGIKKKIYTGAIYLTQVTAFAGFYNSDCSCPIIDFKAQYNFEPTTYQNYNDFLGRNQTDDGNCP